MFDLYLKCLEIQGFKSFAEKITLHFNNGLTSVVGPNGSGKSNIADAVRWVLGEQSAKTLRGGKMEDVIFAGTQQRKPVGFASVTITLDNSDRALPVDYEEVAVGRRMYRSGESEYYLNKTQCRLKDIQELFMNTGVGREGYSIIGQGRIDEILSTRSDERRLVFEEAAGITKYKARKREAERKLENTSQNLERIKDILTELENQLEPLARQAETARLFLDYSNELKGLEVSLFMDTVDKLKLRMDEIKGQVGGIREQIEEENRRIENIKNINRNKNDRLEKLKAELDALRSQLHALDGEIGRQESSIRLSEEKISHLEANNKTYGEDIGVIQERLSQILAETEKKKKRLVQLDRDGQHFQGLLKEAEDELAAIVAKLDEGERAVEEAKSQVMDKQDSLSDSRIRLNNLKNDLENFKRLKGRIGDEIRQSILEKDRENMQKEDLDAALRKTREQIRKTKEAIEEREQQLKEDRSSLEEIRREADGARRDIHAQESRHRVLKDMEQSLEGYSHSVKAVMQAAGSGKSLGTGIYGPLAQLIRVGAKYETAVEIALGGALQNIVTDDEYSAKRAIDYLKSNRLGRATFLPVSSVKARNLEPYLLNGARSMTGFEGLASDMVECEGTFSGVVSNLLGRTVVADTMDSAIAMARRFDYAFRIVTLDGELLNPGGSMSGGSTNQKSSSLIGRQRMIEELAAGLRRSEVRLKELEARLAAKEQELKSHAQEAENHRKILSEQELVRLRDESQLIRVNETIKKIIARTEMLRQQDEELLGQMEGVKAESGEESVRTQALETAIQELKALISEHQSRNKGEQEKRDILHGEINDYRVSVNSVLESRNNVEEQLQHMEEEKNGIEGNMARREDDRKRNLKRIEELKAEIEGFKGRIERLNEEKTGKALKFEGLSEELKLLEEELSGMLEKVTEHNEAILALQEEQGRLEARQAKMEAELETVQNKLWDEYSLTYGTAQELRSPVENPKAVQSRINDLKSRIRALGTVNVAAIEDYARTRERHGFMKTQYDDLVQAGEKLSRVIHDITLVMKKQFVEQFEIINRNFSSVFKELFEGGFAEVQLSDGENVLDSGIDIIVQPPGKKLQNMMLLSGGERAMVAIALIFAILRMRPAPFYILDEIEASLDDANVYKFADYIGKFTDKVQFIAITHRKGTMEAADTLYGVTMQEHGVSKVVSMRLEENLRNNAG